MMYTRDWMRLWHSETMLVAIFFNNAVFNYSCAHPVRRAGMYGLGCAGRYCQSNLFRWRGGNRYVCNICNARVWEDIIGGSGERIVFAVKRNTAGRARSRCLLWWKTFDQSRCLIIFYSREWKPFVKVPLHENIYRYRKRRNGSDVYVDR